MYSNESIRLPQLLPDATDSNSPKNLYLNFLGVEDVAIHQKEKYVASKQLDNLHVVEIKGTFTSDWAFELVPSPTCFWLLFQFIGHAERGTASTSRPLHNEYQGFYSTDLPQQINIKTGKSWLVLLGIEIGDAPGFVSEWPLLKEPAMRNPPPFSQMNIGYRVKQVFEKIQQCRATPYSLHSKIDYHLYQLINIYHQDLKDKAKALHKEDIVIYHEAVEYIREHYMDEGINRDTIAEHLDIGVRKLYRIFKDKNITIHGAIQTIRLYKARELLRETDDSVDMIAFNLNFSTAHYFYKQYVKRFGHSPSKERERHQQSEKKKRRAMYQRARKILPR